MKFNKVHIRKFMSFKHIAVARYDEEGTKVCVTFYVTLCSQSRFYVCPITLKNYANCLQIIIFT